MGPRKSETGNSTKRPVAGLDQRLEKKLISYALAASVAGVGALACLPHAAAEVVFTNTWVPIVPRSSLTNLDLNNDGVVDFMFSNVRTSGSPARFIGSIMNVLPGGSGNLMWGAKNHASALSSGVSVGSNTKFQPGHQFMGSERVTFSSSFSGYGSHGQWRQTTNRYLGVKFMIQGEVHYGWVRMDVTATLQGMYGAISGYAYETVPNKAILTGQKSGFTKKSGSTKKRNKAKNGSASADVPAPTKGDLGTLAIGAVGLQMSRRKDGPLK